MLLYYIVTFVKFEFIIDLWARRFAPELIVTRKATTTLKTFNNPAPEIHITCHLISPNLKAGVM